jgi:hypothetical protein
MSTATRHTWATDRSETEGRCRGVHIPSNRYSSVKSGMHDINIYELQMYLRLITLVEHFISAQNT